MSPLLISTSVLSSQRPSKRNRSPSSRPREPSSRSNKPCKTKSPPLSGLRVKPRPPNFSERPWTDPLPSLTFAESRLLAKLQQLFREAETVCSSRQTLSFLTSLPAWTAILRRRTPTHLLRREPTAAKFKSETTTSEQSDIERNEVSQ